MLENSEKPLLVDFYATWCGPCQFMVPILHEVGESMKDKIQVVKIGTEKYPALADKYKIQALPTFILFKDGDVCDRFEGIDATHRICTGSKAVVLACCLSSCLDHRFEVIRVEVSKIVFCGSLQFLTSLYLQRKLIRYMCKMVNPFGLTASFFSPFKCYDLNFSQDDKL